MTQHPDHQTLTDYRSRVLTEANTDAVEAHLEHCPQCRGQITEEPAWVEESWRQLQSAVRRPDRPWLDRGLSRMGVSRDTAHLIATSPAFRPAWILSVFTVLVATALVSAISASHPVSVVPFLAVAPLIPVFGVAVSYANRRDPVYVITMLTPNGGFKLLLQRTLAVTTLSLLLAAIPAVVFMPADLSLAWLLPAIAATSCTLALGTVLALPIAAAVVGSVWLLLLGGATVWSTPSGVFDPIPYALVAIVALAGFAASQQRQRRKPIR